MCKMSPLATSWTMIRAYAVLGIERGKGRDRYPDTLKDTKKGIYREAN